MAILIPHVFNRYKLTEQEELTGYIFNQTNLAVLQNKLAEICDSILNLEFDPEHSLKFVQNDAYLKGQKQFIQYLLDMHEESTRIMQQLAADAANNSHNS